mmetsp:Transcript_38716/g.65182  ORF Transcript_38716/g.65182 Transcript_38716/m.65182 type:complete len:211 (+) Transcript_38716:241-873(+)|eukprot:CAMPEP_0198208142 /NCGR_PEP_ID=MMETSP1445-20131203/11532_1 /TAXON_ID=36898 /ORGANISM="Pyramimonas sp., Strain CCMP2087" /LENGTH=210 /DNA_ID=CAMNT_0043881427 /DNA_START=259 /DNA_END=891 /DNA_ORIENTATION=-
MYINAWPPRRIRTAFALGALLVASAHAALGKDEGVIQENSDQLEVPQDEFDMQHMLRQLLQRNPGKVTEQKIAFSIRPMEGPASGGTQVTISFPQEFPKGQTDFRCAFGDKVVPVQSFFASPEEKSEPSLLCQSPAGQARSSATVRVTLDGTKFHTGPHFYYHDPISSHVSGGPRVMLSERMGGKSALGQIGKLMTEDAIYERVARGREL